MPHLRSLALAKPLCFAPDVLAAAGAAAALTRLRLAATEHDPDEGDGCRQAPAERHWHEAGNDGDYGPPGAQPDAAAALAAAFSRGAWPLLEVR